MLATQAPDAPAEAKYVQQVKPLASCLGILTGFGFCRAPRGELRNLSL